MPIYLSESLIISKFVNVSSDGFGKTATSAVTPESSLLAYATRKKKESRELVIAYIRYLNLYLLKFLNFDIIFFCP